MNIDSTIWYLLTFGALLFCSALLAGLRIFQPQAAETQAVRLSALDGLRGVLAVSVMLHHCLFYYYGFVKGSYEAPLPGFYAQLGVASVTLFFFITGFLFWKKLMKARSIDFSQFVWQRLARLAPAYWMGCLIFFTMTFVTSHPATHQFLLRTLAQAVGWFAFVGAGHDFNGVSASCYWFGQVWTLRMEWCFYLSLPLLGWFSRSYRRLMLLLAGSVLLDLGSSFLPSTGLLGAVLRFFSDYVGFFSFAFSFGILAAVLPAQAVLAKLQKGIVPILLVLVPVAITLFWLPARYGWIESLTLFLPFLVIASGNDLGGLLSSSAMQFLGRISYSLYLLHSLILVAGFRLLLSVVDAAKLSAPAFWAYSALLAFLAVALSACFWRVFEQPFLRGFPALSRNRATVSANAVI